MPGIVTVTAPATAAKLTQLATVKDELDVADSGSDAKLARMIDRASGAIAGHCRRVFGVETLAETFRLGWEPGIGPTAQVVAPYGTPLSVQRRPLILSKPGVRSVVSVAENGNVLDPSSYEVDAASGLIHRMNGGVRAYWTAPAIVITYTAGWKLPGDPDRDLPADIEDACLSLVRSAWFARARDPNLAMDLTEGVGQAQYWKRSVSGMAIDDALSAALTPYVLRGV